MQQLQPPDMHRKEYTTSSTISIFDHCFKPGAPKRKLFGNVAEGLITGVNFFAFCIVHITESKQPQAFLKAVALTRRTTTTRSTR